MDTPIDRATKSLLMIALFKDGNTHAAIGSMFGDERNAVTRVLNNAGLYRDNGGAVYSRLGYGQKYTEKLIAKYNLNPIESACYKKTGGLIDLPVQLDLESEEHICSLFVENKSVADIAELYEQSKTTIAAVIKKYNVDLR